MLRWLRRLQRKSSTQFRPVILVTGCAAGLGLSLAEILYQYFEYRVVITARAASLPSLKKRFHESDRFWILPMDVNNERERVSTILEIQAKWGDVNILINNAGICYRSVVEHMTSEDEQLQLSTNYLSPMALIRLVLPAMRKVGRGKIINISSVSGMLAMPTMASYSASKHALEGACEALWYEMKPLGINVSLVQPGFINSSSFENVRSTPGSRDAHLRSLPYSDYYNSMGPFIRKLMSLSQADPSSVARQVIKIIRTENPPLWNAATLDAVLFYYVRKFLPRRWLSSVLFLGLPHSSKWAKSYSQARPSIFSGRKPRSFAPAEEYSSEVVMPENVQPLRRIA